LLYAPLLTVALQAHLAAPAIEALTPPPALVAPAPPPALVAPDYSADVPPPTPYDELEGKTLLAPESRGLVAQLGRTIIALFLVVALIYLTMKLLMPRLLKKLPQRGGGAHLRMVERLQLDPTHHVVLLDVENGPRVLLGTSETGVHMLTSFNPQGGDFTQQMLATPNPLPDKGATDAPH